MALLVGSALAAGGAAYRKHARAREALQELEVARGLPWNEAIPRLEAIARSDAPERTRFLALARLTVIHLDRNENAPTLAAGDAAMELALELRAAAGAPVDPEVASAEAEARVRRGLARAGTGQGALAQEDYETAVVVDPRCANAWICLGCSRHRRGDVAGAIADTTRALEVEPHHRNALWNRALFYRIQGDDDAAEKDLRLLESVDPNGHEAPRLLAYLHERRLDFALVATEAARWLANSHGDPYARYVLGKALFEVGELEKARTHLELAALSHTDWQNARAHLGIVRLALGDADVAHALVDQAFAIVPRGGGNLFLARALVREAEGDRDGACADARACLDADEDTTSYGVPQRAWALLGRLGVHSGGRARRTAVERFE